MTKERTQRTAAAATSIVLMGAIMVCALTPPRPTHALPIFTRRYGTPCSTCHVIPPKLNKTGLAFQANHFNWPGKKPPAFHTGLDSIPVTALITSGHFEGQGTETLTAFQTVELFMAGGIKKSDSANGGYWLDYFAATNDNQRASDLDGAWVDVPVSGHHGEISLAAGQFQPMMYQWDGISNLTQAMPAPIDNGVDGISFDSSQPGLRLEWFDNRHQLSANGNYVNIGVPFDGHLTFNRDSQLHGPHGFYVHAFKRVGYTTAGFLGYANGENRYGAAIGTRHVGHYLYLLGVAAVGQDINGTERYLSGQADFVPYPWLAVSGRYESIMGDVSDAYPVFALTVYPGKMYWLRFDAETVQQRSARSNSVFMFLQL